MKKKLKDLITFFNIMSCGYWQDNQIIVQEISLWINEIKQIDISHTLLLK